MNVYLKRGNKRMIAGLVLVVISGLGLLSQEKRTKVYNLSEMDMFCAFYIHEGGMPEIRVTGAVREEKTLLTDGDEVYLDQGRQAGLEPGALFAVIAFDDGVDSPPSLVHRRGLARIVSVLETGATARLEKTCGAIRVGDYIVPHMAREAIQIREQDLAGAVFSDENPAASLIYLQDGLVQVGSGHLALVDAGVEGGLSLGQQLAIYRTVREGYPPKTIGNSVVVSIGNQTATIRLLSCLDAVLKGDLVQPWSGK